jgi:hypothetical protein
MLCTTQIFQGSTVRVYRRQAVFLTMMRNQRQTGVVINLFFEPGGHCCYITMLRRTLVRLILYGAFNKQKIDLHFFITSST